MSSQNITLSEALVGSFATSGHQVEKFRNNQYSTGSLLREEKEPSLKVTRKMNAWYDPKLSLSLSFRPQTLTLQQPRANSQKAQEALEPKIKVIAARPPLILLFAAI